MNKVSIFAILTGISFNNPAVLSMDPQSNQDQAERLIRLEEKHHSTYKLTCQIADNADTTAKALQELVLIHKETRLRSEADRISIQATNNEVTALKEKHYSLYRTVWRVIYMGMGSAAVLGVLWYTGLLGGLISANELQEMIYAMAL